MKKKTLSLFLAIALIVSLLVLPVNAADDSDFKLTLVHTNDVHSNVDIEPYVKGYADALKAKGENVVLISAGDAFAGTSFASLSEGQDVATVMNMVGYEMMAIGNHEQAMSASALKAVDKATNFPFLGANAYDALRETVDVHDYVIKEVEGVKIAFIGLTIGNDQKETGAELVAAAEKARDSAKAEGATVFVGVFHLGITADNEELRSTYVAKNCQWLTAVIDGHSHSALESGMTEGDVLIAQTGEYGNNIGVVELYFKDGKVTNKSASLIAIKGAESTCGITPDAKVKAFIKKVSDENSIYLNEVLATLPVALDGERATNRAVETLFGDLLTDSMRKATEADFALVSGFYIRASADAGKLTRETFLTMILGYGTKIHLSEITGADLIALIETSLSAQPEVSSHFKQVSGMRITYDETKEAGSRIVTITDLEGNAIDKEKTYTVASTDKEIELIFGEDAVLDKNYKLSDKTIDETFLAYLNDKSTVWETDGRIKSVNLTFTDVAASDWYYGAVKFVSENKIMNGTGAKSFDPGMNLNRAMMVQVLYNLEGKPSVSAKADFSDVAADAWYADAVAWASANGIVNGVGDKKFAPQTNISREEMATILHRYCQYKEIELKSIREDGAFADADIISSWAAEAVASMYAAEIINGKGEGIFDPSGNATRAEVATLFMNFMEAAA